MGRGSNIEWTGHTWNPWRGCTKVSPGCDDCYMFREQRRYGRDPEVVTRCAPATFNAPLKWKDPSLVFTCSWSDFFHKDADPWRDEAWDIIRRTPHLTYQVLTKRPALIEKRLPSDWGNGWSNVWLGISAEAQQYYDARWHLLERIPAVVRFVSYEPAIGPLTLKRGPLGLLPHWVIPGGESGHGARQFNVQWARSVRDQCRDASIACFIKQLGSNPIITEDVLEVMDLPAGHHIEGGVATLRFRDRKGGDLSEWPADLRVREWPQPRTAEPAQ